MLIIYRASPSSNRGDLGGGRTDPTSKVISGVAIGGDSADLTDPFLSIIEVPNILIYFTII